MSIITGVIKSLTSKLGITFPITVIKAVYDADTGESLDVKLESINESIEQNKTDISTLNTKVDNVQIIKLGNGTYYTNFIKIDKTKGDVTLVYTTSNAIGNASIFPYTLPADARPKSQIKIKSAGWASPNEDGSTMYPVTAIINTNGQIQVLYPLAQSMYCNLNLNFNTKY